MSKSALVIIDMQSHFLERLTKSSAKKKSIRVIQSIVERIKLARQNKIPILIIEYEGHGETHPLIRSAIKGYRDTVFISKESDDGSKDILFVTKKRKVNKFLIVGAFLESCICETATGLKLKKKKVLVDPSSVLENRDYDDDYDDYMFSWKPPFCMKDIKKELASG